MSITPAMQAAESSSAKVLQEKQPELYALIKKAVEQDKVTPAQIDKYVHLKFGLPKGNPVRDTCYLAACHFQRAQHRVHPTAAGGSTSDNTSESGGG